MEKTGMDNLKVDLRLTVVGAMLLCSHGQTFAFTQSGVGIDVVGNAIPMGHEWVTRISAMELIGNDPVVPPDPGDPRKNWKQGKAKNLALGASGTRELARIKSKPKKENRYQSTYDLIFAAIVGERWVDIGGFNVTKANIGGIDCWDAVAQEPVEVQKDHFMRRYDDIGGQGGIDAARRSQQRFIDHFVAAAMAPQGQMKVWDGGGYSKQEQVDRNYFLFGRAAHLFQDAFSSEHTVRIPQDNYEQVRQVKSYLCAKGSEQHSHQTSAVFDFTSGDVIWKPGTRFDSGWGGYKPSNMKDVALVATEASKDLWAAFIRTMAEPISSRRQKAQSEAETLVANWLSLDEKEVLHWYDNQKNRIEDYVLADDESGKGQLQSDCMKGLGVKSGKQMDMVRRLEQDQRMCLYNLQAEPGYADLNDPHLHMPFNWKWKNPIKWQEPPRDWTIPRLPADSGRRVTINSASNNLPMTAASIKKNAWIYTKKASPLEFTVVGAPSKGAYLRLTGNADLFLSYRLADGAVKLLDSPSDATYVLKRSGNAWTIYNQHWKNYMWLNAKTMSPYVSGKGKPGNTNAHWKIDGL